MFSYIKGNLEVKSLSYIVVDVNGVGFKIYMPQKSIDDLPDIGQNVKINTYMQVREDDISLYGFNSAEELRLFELLISVSGIGAKSAISMLSNIEPTEFAISVISDDVDKLTKLPGVGKKTAQRIILELKDKLKEENVQTKAYAEEIRKEIVENGKVEEVIAALQVLGYNRNQIDKVIDKIDVNNLEIEDIIKTALKMIS